LVDFRFVAGEVLGEGDDQVAVKFDFNRKFAGVERRYCLAQDLKRIGIDQVQELQRTDCQLVLFFIHAHIHWKGVFVQLFFLDQNLFIN
jgi:hypothetical protein